MTKSEYLREYKAILRQAKTYPVDSVALVVRIDRLLRKGRKWCSL